ncbi:hypothetical protein VCUG_02131 [Vavraia culicis subsp. floridensis]|uniref:Uncharacterized protein n=1 Tax=Vavraia culicis (isolate floridensis) TaxID=948595 RepID=L2GSP6_VAVCU|nr:uncharacterized protein VCUG_02131 [Vavraia culicis subsp. floridensis]ELA46367.1 hypothetical protein VCUG_02131 [Vavraia culicis subsp. floridensis]
MSADVHMWMDGSKKFLAKKLFSAIYRFNTLSKMYVCCLIVCNHPHQPLVKHVSSALTDVEMCLNEYFNVTTALHAHYMLFHYQELKLLFFYISKNIFTGNAECDQDMK